MEPGAVVTPPFVARPLRLLPFRALRLPPRRVGDPGTLRQLSRATRASGLTTWHERSHVEHDAIPALYLHEYTSGGLTVRGLVGALDISRRARRPDERAVLPHEGIRPVQADDLADRMEELALNPAPILLVHRAEPALRAILAQVATTGPRHDYVDRREQRHRIWVVQDPGTIGAIDSALGGAQALIADGHHRYAAYLRMQRRRPGGAADRGLAMLVDQETTPLFLGPIHRSLSGVTLEDLATAARTTGHELELTDRDHALAGLGPHTLTATDGSSWATLRLEQDPEDRAAVEVLHEDVLPALPRGPQSIHYVHSVEEALRAVRRSRRVSILMPAPDVDQVHRIAQAGRLLPEKATSFQPKPSVGSLFRSLADG